MSTNDPTNPQNYPQPYPPAGFPPPKKKHTVRNVLLVLTALFVLFVGGCFALVGTAANEVAKQEAKVHTITYTVTGTVSKADINYDDGTGSSADANGAKLPWHKTVKAKGSFNFYSVIATSGFDGKAKITCQIKVDGKVVKKATATGQLATASCTH